MENTQFLSFSRQKIRVFDNKRAFFSPRLGDSVVLCFLQFTTEKNLKNSVYRKFPGFSRSVF